MRERKFFKENDLVIITGKNARGYFRIKYDEEICDYCIMNNKEYNSALNSECLKFVDNLNNTSIYYILDEYSDISIDVYRQTKDDRIGNHIFFIDLFEEE